jgi:purine-binding chemotaxis protein CheW
MSVESIGKYLTFDLAGQCFAVDVSRVEVVLESMPITRVPKASEHLRGVINYRGAVIPVADMRTRFGEGLSPSGPGSSIIVLQLRYGSEDITIGMLADAVREVIDLEPSRIERPPRVGAGDRIEDAFVKGVCEHGGEFIVILDIDLAFAADPAAERGTEPK